MSSLCVNLALLLVLTLFAFPGALLQEVTFITLDPATEGDVAESLFALETQSSMDASAPAESLADAGVPLELPETELPTELPTTAPDAPLIDRPRAYLKADSYGFPPGQALIRPKGIGRAPPRLTPQELRRNETIEDAVDNVGLRIDEALEHGDLMVIWMLDASLSLVDDRQRVALRLAEVYKNLDEKWKQKLSEAPKGTKPPQFLNTVVAYGGDIAEVLPPSTRGDLAVLAVAGIPLDETGKENVFSAIQWCIERYADRWRRQVLLVIWTDESGDDILKLEPTIAACRHYGVRVHVVGPTAVLGAEQGTHAFVHPLDLFRRTHWLPVKKGPDTAFPERLRLPYWTTNRLPDWHDRNIPNDMYPRGWYGGHSMESIASGFPPYALMRLTRETGGSYTIFDRPYDRGPFTPEIMEPYTPDYRSAAEIFEDLQYQPFRRAIMASVEVTRARRFPSPTRPNVIPFGSEEQVQRQFEDWATNGPKYIASLEAALAPFGPNGLEDFYEQETSPRWRAWYDLTRGRLLSQSVRYAETMVTCQVAVAKDPRVYKCNCVRSFPIPLVKSGWQSQQRIAEAERLLRRCIEQNPGTPWAYLAHQELGDYHGMGYLLWVSPPPPEPMGGGFDVPVAPLVMPRL